MASYRPQALCCPRPCGNTRYPLASTSCPPLVGSDVPVSGLACAQLSGACVSWGLGRLGGGGITRVLLLDSESRPCRFCHWGDGLGHKHHGALGRVGVCAPPPRLMTPWGQRAESCPPAHSVQGRRGREAWPCSQALEEPALQRSRVAGLMEPGPQGHIQGQEAGWGALMLQPGALPPGAAGWGVCTFNTIQRGFIGKPLREPVPQGRVLCEC